jgi:hypothetical protein
MFRFTDLSRPSCGLQEQYKLFIPTAIRFTGSRKTESEKNLNHRDIVRTGRRKHTGRRHALQKLPAEALGNPVPSVGRNDEDPAKLEFVIGPADLYARLLEDIVPISFVGRLQGGDRGERVTGRAVKRKPPRITNAPMQTLIRALEALAN